VINDLHLGVTRVAGTTPASAAALRNNLQESFYRLVNQHLDKDIIILGDLFDSFTVDAGEIWSTFSTLSSWLDSSAGMGTRLILVAGNHDWAPRGAQVSSFHLLAAILETLCPSRVRIVDTDHGLSTVAERIYVIPHVPNQDLFDIELNKALELPDGYLLLHANCANFFAEKSDHSLNVNEDMLAKLAKKHRVLFAHEHLHRELAWSKTVTVLGNQFPSSVSDCLAHGEGQKDGKKYAHVIESDLGLTRIETWSEAGSYAEIPWTELGEDDGDEFVRVVGQATAAQAADVINAISKYRQRSAAYVVSNAVEIEGIAGVDELATASLESVRAFDVLGALLEVLDPEEAKVIREVMA
jgi:hypothetical protein